MIILGIDPGTTAIGYAFIKKAATPRLLHAGLMNVHAKSRTEELKNLHQEMVALIKRWQPSILSLEKIFFSKNTKTALAVAEGRGVILLTAHLAGLRVYEYTPLEVKKTVTGDGGADKNQVEKMVRLTVKESVTLDAQDDVFDAIAIALTCFFKERHPLAKPY